MTANSPSADIEAAAAAWLARRVGGFTAADEAALEAWLDASTAHRVAYLRLLTAWEKSARLRELGVGIAPGEIPPRPTWREPTEDPVASPVPALARRSAARGVRRRWLAVAAGVAAVGLASVFALTAFPRAEEYATAVGTIRTVPLADGSSITLDTDSRLHVRLTATERRVTLDRGEAFFQVAHDPRRPFVVRGARARVTAVGTEFMISREPQGLRLLVTQGRVRLERESWFSRSTPLTVDSGTGAHTDADTMVPDHPTPSQLDQLTSWRDGYLLFRDTPLGQAVAEFNRYTHRPLVLDDPTLAALKIGGRFRCTDSEAFVALLQSGFPIRVTDDASGVHLLRR